MAWRVTDNLIDGTLDNTTSGRVTGELRFLGRKAPVRFDLAGDFAGECRGKRLVLKHAEPQERNRTLERPGSYMTGFKRVQRGEVGTMQLDERSGYVYLEWYGDKNGRVVIELPREQVEILSE